ncbi:GerAB/ArcD/ProY family transporter [Sulfobacillus harzensis]|uniref:GerAB/ArcD/ProY family transporter n=1 Tax=Sulfobacillus harzensis TaxID=2729629 RepID=A0A7Y0L0S9_9FIRM|nr:GerAB/ArcD/ProY family transporter [Sulfobacillus harzensis]NMP21209.1 GerAB/ArcD/ProY family transporter [Sulfobacillus harzensis]
MAKQKLRRISAGQFATMMTAAYTGLGIFYFPREAVSSAGREGLYAFWLDGLIAFALMRLIFRTNRVAPNETLSGFASSLLSKPVGYLIGVYTIVYHLALVIAATVLFSMVLGNVFLPSTPIWAIDGALTLTAITMAWSGAAALARTLQASYIPLLVLTVLSISLAAVSIRHPTLLMPSGDISILPILKGAYRQFLIFIGFQLSVTLYPFVREGDQKKAERYSYYALFGIILALTMQYEVIVGVFGPTMTSQLRWPLASAYRIISISGFYISKLGTLLIVLWTIVVTAFVSVRLWCLAHDLSVFLKSFVSIRYTLGLIIMGGLAFWGEILFPNAQVTNIWTERWLIPFGVGYLVGIPLLVLTVAAIRKEKTLHLKTMPEKGKEL